jgi:hypothetical protein
MVRSCCSMGVQPHKKLEFGRTANVEMVTLLCYCDCADTPGLRPECFFAWAISSKTLSLPS